MTCDPLTNAACAQYETPTPTWWPTPTPTPAVNELAFTGAPVWLWLIIAFCVLAGGFAIRYALRNRTTT